ncbi:hydrophobic/amphiphilic exporter-1, HAE1 family [Abditibacterium utsteinense]|uniref:Hydrophobic/amphiphilic exporter-1, HAE1 family n=1 Tax=Abditibacterium utsteinense TaxID=1960156 RepID=A0A2S8SPT4_9BACT|nr:efflux RND transporter permease subunit [Abditibacterium utsteinense]PQV62813.1 hydrophobic/amphiphilic exporter-1, HAE1 family [Abditibacterium utsteinense]
MNGHSSNGHLPNGQPVKKRAPIPQGNNPLHMIHRWSIEHGYAVVAFYVAVVVMAAIAMATSIPRRFAPYVQSPVLGVVTMMPGLSAEEMELQISKPLEEQLVNVSGIRYIRSTSQGGFSLVALEFPYGTNIEKATVEVQTLLNVAQANLPATGANLKPSFIVPIDALNLPVVSFALSGDEKLGWTSAKLRQFADNEVLNRLKTVPNVYSVVPFGGYRRQLQVLVNREKLAGYGLSILDVKAAIDRQNVQKPAGNLTTSMRESIVTIDSRALNARDVLNFPVKAVGKPENGAVSAQIVTIRDVATVVDGYFERRSAYRFLSHEAGTAGEAKSAIEVSVIQNPGASSATVVPAVMDVVRQIERDNPGVHFQAAYDNKKFVDILFQNVWHELAIAILLCGLAVLFFLGEWRGTLISMITIPTSLAFAVLMMVPFGMTFNSGTLIGLLLSIGRLVDDTIIDIHSVEKHLRMGKSAKTATIDGIAEVRLAVLASTLMLVLALMPLIFSGGITGLMFVELVWPIIFALLASMLVSFTLTALLCANFLRPESQRESDRKNPFLRAIYFFVDPFQRGLHRLENAYGRLIAWMLKNRFVNLARVAATVLVGFTFYYFIGSEMMPLADVGQANGFLEMQPGTSFSQTERAVKDLERIMLRHPELERASIEVGQETMLESWNPYFTGYSMPSPFAASMMMTFSDKEARKNNIWQVIDSVQAEAMATIPGIRRLQIKEMGSDVMATAAAPIHLVIFGKDLSVLDQLAKQTMQIVKTDPTIKANFFQPATTWTLGMPDYRIKVDPRRAAEIGLSPSEISDQAYYSLRGSLTDEFYRLPNLRQNTISVRLAPNARRTSNDLENLYITGSNGQSAPLKSVATIQLRRAPSVIEHDQLRRVIGVTGYYRKGHLPSMDVGMEVMMKSMEKLNFPPGYGIEMRGDMTQMMDSFRRLLHGLILALVFMYLVLVAQFRGFLQPLQMIASLPLELAGVFTALWLAGQSFSTVSIMAIIVLTGMDITTAILMIDNIMRLRDEGIPRDEAIIQACPQRLSPILMTSLITILVMIPVAFFPKTGLDAYQPLATTILGGLFVGTTLSLLDIPIMHTYVDDFIVWLNRTFLKREWTWPIAECDEDAEMETESRELVEAKR